MATVEAAAEAVPMVEGTGRFRHHLQLSRPTALAVGRLHEGTDWGTVFMVAGGFSMHGIASDDSSATRTVLNRSTINTTSLRPITVKARACCCSPGR
jgi:hypothetical protein